MYIPKPYIVSDREECVRFMREFNFATLVTTVGDELTATHLPFLIEVRGDRIVLVAHMARANDQWRELGTGRALVIFQGPHAYISPNYYVDPANVPTWNYAAVHAYGRSRLCESAEENLAMLSKMVEAFDRDYFLGSWQSLTDDYKLQRANAIVAFEITVDDLQGKKKLNQTMSAEDGRRVIGALSQSEFQNERQIAGMMKKIYDKS